MSTGKKRLSLTALDLTVPEINTTVAGVYLPTSIIFVDLKIL
jgi:hypothetical protein